MQHVSVPITILRRADALLRELAQRATLPQVQRLDGLRRELRPYLGDEPVRPTYLSGAPCVTCRHPRGDHYQGGCAAWAWGPNAGASSPCSCVGFCGSADAVAELAGVGA